MNFPEKIKKLIANMQLEFALNYSNLTRHLKRCELTMSMIADYANLNYQALRNPQRYSENEQTKLYFDLKKVNIDKLAKRFIKKH